jgi:hypothetical protein
MFVFVIALTWYHISFEPTIQTFIGQHATTEIIHDWFSYEEEDTKTMGHKQDEMKLS